MVNKFYVIHYEMDGTTRKLFNVEAEDEEDARRIIYAATIPHAPINIVYVLESKFTSL